MLATSTIHLPANHPAYQLVRVAFPDYNGRKVAVEVSASPFSFESSWDSGNRDYHCVIRLSDMAVVPVPQNGTPYDRVAFSERPVEPGFAVVTHHVRGRGPDSVTITINPENAGHLALPAPTELTRAEKIVLSATRSLKSSYAGVSNYRFIEAQRQTGITSEQWDVAKQSLIGRKMLNAAGAITADGKNAIGWTELWALK